MATFSDASKWLKLVFFLNALGLADLVCGLVFGLGIPFEKDAPEIAVGTLSFVFYTLALCLAFSWTFVEEARSNKGVQISTIVFDFLTVAIILATIVLQSISRGIYFAGGLTFAVAALLALLSAIFGIVEISGEVTFKVKLPSPKKGKKKAKDVEAPAEENKGEVVELEETTEITKEDAKPTEAAAAAVTEDANGHVVTEEEKEAKEEQAEQKEEAKEEAPEEAPKDEAPKE